MMKISEFEFFIAFIFVIILIVVISSDDKTALLMVAVIAIAALWARPCFCKNDTPTTPPVTEKFSMIETGIPGPTIPDLNNIPVTEFTEETYPGAIDFGEMTRGTEAAAMGHLDWSEKDRDDVPRGNPFSTNRVSAPQSSAPCQDGEAFGISDIDELNTYQVRARNVPERTWAGITRRKELVSRYVNEELDERENAEWWGQHEL